MSRRTLAVLATSGALTVVLGGPAFAQVACDTYSKGCEPDDSSIIDRGGADDSSTTERPSNIPFTGGELVLLTTLGAGALAGGTALVVAGRRKPSAQS